MSKQIREAELEKAPLHHRVQLILAIAIIIWVCIFVVLHHIFGV